MVCGVCKGGFDASDPMNIVKPFSIPYHPHCYEELQLKLRGAGEYMRLRTDNAHNGGGYCPICRAYREAGSQCWGV